MSTAHRLFYPALPVVAEHAPHRAVYVGDADGRCEIFAWDRLTGTAWRVTDRPTGTSRAAISPDGATLWWFDDDLAGIGRWRVRAFDAPGTPPVPATGALGIGAPGTGPGTDAPATGPGAADPLALPQLAPARHAGLAMAADGTAVLGLSDEAGLTLHARSADGRTALIGQVSGYASLVDLDPTGRLLVVGTDAARDDAVRVLNRRGALVARLAGAVDSRVWALGFAPDATGPATLLLALEEADEYLLATWTERDGLRRHGWRRFDTEITASWYPDGAAVLVRQDRHAGSLLHQVELSARTSAAIDTPPGSLLDAGVWPDGDVAYVWSDSLTPPQVRSVRGVELPRPPDLDPSRPPGQDAPAGDGGSERAGDAAAASRDVALPGQRRERIWIPGPGGDIHTLLAAPADRAGPLPAVFLVHGGPFQHARDAYDPLVELLVSTGCAVVRVNYRGSSGYGATWRNDFSAGVGLTQLEDLAAVRAWLVEQELIIPHRVALWGTSWGGYLTLLALGVQPELWRLGVAISPVADYVAAFEAATPAVRALDVRLFGGTPDQRPEGYARSSPVTYVDQVRAPVFLAVSVGDVQCPPAPVRRYAQLLERRQVPCQLVQRSAGHEDLDARSHFSLMRAVLLFMQRHFDGVRSEGTSVALAMTRPAS